MRRIRFQFWTFVILSLLVLVVGTIGFMLIEDLSVGDAFYFCVVTITTVGYGDIHPLTMPGKIFSACLIVAGVGTFLALITNAAQVLLSQHTRRMRLSKLDMVIGAFYSSLGTELIQLFVKTDPNADTIRHYLTAQSDWTNHDFARLRRVLREYKFQVALDNADLTRLRDLLQGDRDLLMRLIENPTLIDHEYFTNVLWALFHLSEELHLREDFHELPPSDLDHLAGDVDRAYVRLVFQWLLYMENLKSNYPYMFSLAMRRNPFNPEASVIVR